MAEEEFSSRAAAQAAGVGASAAAVGHRLAGTAAAVASMVAESKAANVAQLEAQLEAFKAEAQKFKAEAQELHKLWADMDDDLVSDSESAAMSEPGEEAVASRQRKTERAEVGCAKRKKLRNQVKVVSKFGAA